MAIDTLAKRGSMLNFGSGDLLPVPDGALTSPDWLTLLDLYGGILAIDSSPPVPDIPFAKSIDCLSQRRRISATSERRQIAATSQRRRIIADTGD